MTAPRLPDWQHAHGCRARPERIETFERERPADQGGGTFEVTRCCDCAAQVVVEKREDDDDGS